IACLSRTVVEKRTLSATGGFYPGRAANAVTERRSVKRYRLWATNDLENSSWPIFRRRAATLRQLRARINDHRNDGPALRASSGGSYRREDRAGTRCRMRRQRSARMVAEVGCVAAPAASADRCRWAHG